MANAIEKKLYKLENLFDKLNKNLNLLKKETALKFAAIDKETKIQANTNTTLAKRLKDLEKLKEEVANINSELNSLHTSIDKIQDSLNTNKKIINDLSTVSKNIIAKVAAAEKAWNPVVLKNIVETLSAFNKMITNVEKRDSANAKKLTKIQNGIFAISKHARDVEAEHTDAKFAALELAKKAENLKETINYFLRNTESINNKINANTTNLTELTEALELAKNKILALENQTSQLVSINEKLEKALRDIDNLLQKVNYLEKTTVKTIVLE